MNKTASQTVFESKERYFILRSPDFRIKDVLHDSYDHLMSIVLKKDKQFEILEYRRSTGKENVIFSNREKFEKDTVDKKVFSNKEVIKSILDKLEWDKERIIDLFPKSGIIFIRDLNDVEVLKLKEQNIRELFFEDVKVISKSENKLTVKCFVKSSFNIPKDSALNLDMLV